MNDRDLMIVEGEPVVGAPRARIVNPELSEEAIIIRESKLYQIMDQREDPVDVTLRLRPLQLEQQGCGMGMFGFVLTCGLGPGAVWEAFTFTFEECETGARRMLQGSLGSIYGMHHWFSFSGRAAAIGDSVGKAFAVGYQPLALAYARAPGFAALRYARAPRSRRRTSRRRRRPS